jgi:hypothetical protein
LFLGACTGRIAESLNADQPQLLRGASNSHDESAARLFNVGGVSTALVNPFLTIADVGIAA